MSKKLYLQYQIIAEHNGPWSLEFSKSYPIQYTTIYGKKIESQFVSAGEDRQVAVSLANMSFETPNIDDMELYASMSKKSTYWSYWTVSVSDDFQIPDEYSHASVSNNATNSTWDGLKDLLKGTLSDTEISAGKQIIYNFVKEGISYGLKHVNFSSGEIAGVLYAIDDIYKKGDSAYKLYKTADSIQTEGLNLLQDGLNNFDTLSSSDFDQRISQFLYKTENTLSTALIKQLISNTNTSLGSYDKTLSDKIDSFMNKSNVPDLSKLINKDNLVLNSLNLLKNQFYLVPNIKDNGYASNYVSNTAHGTYNYTSSDDLLISNSSQMILNAGTGNNVIAGGAGNQYMQNAGGYDTYLGGGGVDVVRVDKDFTLDTVVNLNSDSSLQISNGDMNNTFKGIKIIEFNNGVYEDGTFKPFGIGNLFTQDSQNFNNDNLNNPNTIENVTSSQSGNLSVNNTNSVGFGTENNDTIFVNGTGLKKVYSGNGNDFISCGGKSYSNSSGNYVNSGDYYNNGKTSTDCHYFIGAGDGDDTVSFSGDLVCNEDIIVSGGNGSNNYTIGTMGINDYSRNIRILDFDSSKDHISINGGISVKADVSYHDNAVDIYLKDDNSHIYLPNVKDSVSIDNYGNIKFSPNNEPQEIPLTIDSINKITYNSHTYLLSHVGTWEEAQAEAQSLDGNLVTINNQAENDWLVETFGTEIFWTGLSYSEEEGAFKWISDEPVTYTNWHIGEPNSGGMGFGTMNWDVIGTWDDNSNGDTFAGIIEIAPTNISPTREVTVSAPEFNVIAEDNVIEPNEQEEWVVISGSAEDGTFVTLSSGDFNVEFDQTIDNSWTHELTSEDYELLDTDEFGYASIKAVAVNESGNESDENFTKVLVIDSQNWKIGNDNKNTLSGKNIYGGDGADTLKGNSTDGLFIGGAGKDTITGGKGFDTFMYLDITDSGTTKATRDVIKDFKSLENDKIDLSHLPDSSTFHFTESNIFDGETGSIIFSKGILSLDLDSDTKADFSIELTGVKILNSEDLILN